MMRTVEAGDPDDEDFDDEATQHILDPLDDEGDDDEDDLFDDEDDDLDEFPDDDADDFT